MAKVQLAQRQYNETVSQVVPKQEMQINIEPLISVGEKIMQAEADSSALKALSQAAIKPELFIELFPKRLFCAHTP